MSEKIRNLFSNSTLNIYIAKYICGEGWWLDDEGVNWWNRTTVFPYNAIYLTKVGCFDLKINDTWHHIEPHRLVFIPAGSKLEFNFDGKGPLEKYFVHFDLNYSVGTLSDYFEVPNLIVPKDEDKVESLFSEIIKNLYDSENPISSVASSGAMMALVANTLEDGGATFSYAKNPETKEMYKIAEYIESRYRESISVSELSEAFGYSTTYFTKKFKRTFGCTPTDYISNLKIERARRLLSGSEMTVTEIASDLGFSDASHFSSVFKMKTGLSPATYRKERLLIIKN